MASQHAALLLKVSQALSEASLAPKLDRPLPVLPMLAARSKAPEAARWPSSDVSDDAASTASTTDTSDEKAAKAVIKNIPCRCRQESITLMLVQLGLYDDVVQIEMPTRVVHDGNRSRTQSKGYAFVTFRSASARQKFVQVASGHRLAGRCSGKALFVEPFAPRQEVAQEFTIFSF
jgi:hypothetical protein